MTPENELKDLITKALSGSFSTAFNALVEVSKICRKDLASVPKFSSLGGTSALLELLEKPKYTDICSSILANCCMDNTVREEVIKSGGIRSFVTILSCIEKESTRNRACRGLANIAATSRGAREVRRCKGIEHIVSFLSSSNSCDCQMTALRAVRILANTPECREDLVSHNAPTATAKFLSTESLQKPAVQALASLTQSCSPECALQIRDAEAFKSLQELLQTSDSAVLESTFATVVNLSVVGEVRPDLGAVQVVPTLISHLSNYKLHKPSYETLFSTLCRYSQESVNRVRIRTAGGLTLLVKALVDRSRKDLWPCAVCAILQFRYDEPSLAVLWHLKVVPSLLEHIRDYTSAHKKDQHGPSKPESLAEAASGLKEMHVSTDPEEGVDIGHPKQGGESLPDCSLIKQAAEIVSATITFMEENEDNVGVQTDKCGTVALIPTQNMHNGPVHHGQNDGCIAPGTKNEVVDTGEATHQALSEDMDSELDDNDTKAPFCIHSPSYQEIRGQGGSALDSESLCTDVGYQSSVCSPQSPDQMRHPSPSPPPPSGRWSPQSTDSGCWSPSSSPRCDSPVSVCSPRPFRSFSPVCSDDDEASSEQSASSSRAENMAEPVSGGTPKKTGFIRRKRSSICEDVVGKICTPLRAKRCRRRTISETIPPVYKDAEEALLDGMFKIMSVYSVQEIPEYKLADAGLFDVLLCYLRHVPDPLQRAGQLMNRITADVHSFEDIVCKGNVLKLVEVMAPCSLPGCQHCRQFGDLCKRWLANLTRVAESGYGSGVLAHCLLTEGKKIQHCCCLTLPYVVCDKSILRQLLFDCSGLDILLDILEDSKGDAVNGDFRCAADSLKALCTSISDEPNARVAATAAASGSSNACRLPAFKMDVQLQVDDGSRVTGNRLRLSESNDYFKTMLDGYFVEKGQTVIMFRSADRTPLSIVIHFLHGCNFETCTFMSSDVPVNVQLDVLGLCDLLLLPSLQRQTEIRVRQNLTLESVCDVYSRAVELGMTGFRRAALWFVLTEKLDPEECCRCLCSLVGGKHGGQVLDDIAHLVRENLDGRDSPSALCC